MCVDRLHIVSLFLSNPCTTSTLSKEAFVYFVCHTEIPQPPFPWKYDIMTSAIFFCEQVLACTESSSWARGGKGALPHFTKVTTKPGRFSIFSDS